MVNRKKQIQKLRSRIKELQKIYKGDVCESYREAAQTQDMIVQYQTQLQNLLNQEEGSLGKRFKLKTKNGLSKTFTLTDSNPDPANLIVTIDSTLGKKLSTTKIGEKVRVGEHIFIVIEITD